MKTKPIRSTGKVEKETVLIEATKTNDDDLTTLTFQVPKAIHKSFKAKTAANGEKMKDVIVNMVNEYINNK